MKRQQDKYQCRSMEQLAVTLPGSETGSSAAPLISHSSPRLQRCSADRSAPCGLQSCFAEPAAQDAPGDLRLPGRSSAPRAVFWMYRWGLDDLFGFPTDFLLSCDGKCCTNEKLKAQDSQPVARSYCHRHQPSALPSSPCASCKDASHRSEWVSQGERVLAEIPVRLHGETGESVQQ